MNTWFSTLKYMLESNKNIINLKCLKSTLNLFHLSFFLRYLSNVFSQSLLQGYFPAHKATSKKLLSWVEIQTRRLLSLIDLWWIHDVAFLHWMGEVISCFTHGVGHSDSGWSDSCKIQCVCVVTRFSQHLFTRETKSWREETPACSLISDF